MKLFFSFLLLLQGFHAIAQEIATNKYRYFGLHSVGLQAGGSTQSGSLLTTNGVATGNWYAGLTTGIDWYGVRSIPVLGSVYKAFTKNKNQPFVYGQAGLSCPWEKPYYYEGYPVSESSYKNSFMGEAGLGYFISLKNKTAINLSVGYSYKTARVKGSYADYMYTILGTAPYTIMAYDNTSHYRRIAIRVGIKI